MRLLAAHKPDETIQAVSFDPLVEITFQAGRKTGGQPLELTPGTVTLLVGPNSSGKSKTLVDLASWSHGSPLPGIVVRDARAHFPDSLEEAKELLGSYVKADPRPDYMKIGAPTVPGGGGGDEDVYKTAAVEAFDPQAADTPERDALRRRMTVKFLTALWTGRERFGLASDQQLSDLQQPPQNHLQVLFRDDALRDRVRSLVHEAFGVYFVLDPTQPGQLRMRLSSIRPPGPAVERGLDEAAIAFHQATVSLQEQSDGVQCYVGMIVALMSLPLRLVLLDEPEAFLHPPLARRLGEAISEIARHRGARVVAATHSADFLRGCVESSASTSIVRLTHDRQTGEATARALATGELRPLMTDPLLRSTRALEGLFHRAVVVGESDADRAFYDEVNRRLVSKSRGISDAQFVNAQNWSTEARIIGPLRRLGVPAAGILDFDTLWNPLGEWRKLYRAIGLPEGDATRLHLESQQAALARDQNERTRCKVRGAAGLPVAKRAPMRTFLGELAEFGVFVVPTGELESWLPELNIARSPKPRWIVDMLTTLGTDPKKPDYVEPGRGGVWRFIDRVEDWVANPQRLGMPS